jgi:CRISPR/Cas system-associated exonuclease Cas4 (RecB family)
VDPFDRFAFSQSSLQDYVDCRRRFYLRYVQRVAWPALQAEPARENEQHMQRGERFHRLAQQYLLGVPEDRLTLMAEEDADEHLRTWWANFLDCVPSALIGRRHVEVQLSAPLGSFRLVAKYDLVLVQPDGRVIIYDWKTGAKRPKRARLAQRMQTRVYPYLLAQAGAAINDGCAFDPAQIEMIYWFTEPQQPPELFPYSAQHCQEDGTYLVDLVEQIKGLRKEEFEMTPSTSACRYCVYRSLCGRGIRAASLLDDSGEEDGAPEFQPEDTGELDFNLEQIGEISF